MKIYLNHFFTFIFLFILCQKLNAQFNYNSVEFTQLPQNYQLYPKDEDGFGEVRVTGKVLQNSFFQIELNFYRGDTIIATENIYPTQQNFTFNFKIKAELVDYKLEAINFTSETESSILFSKTNLVAGELIVISGQSNSWGGYQDDILNAQTYAGNFARGFGVHTINNNYEIYSNADTLWAIPNSNGNVIGMLGTEIQKQLIEKYQIPIAVINGGSGGSSAYYNALKNEQNPLDLSTSYGKILYKITKSGFWGKIKLFIYRQGEAEGTNSILPWLPNVSKLFNNLFLDLPNLKHFMFFQNNIFDNFVPDADQLREIQRKFALIHSSNTSIQSSMGLPNYDGIHYGVVGHKQAATNAIKTIEKILFNTELPINYTAPNIEKAYFIQNKEKLVLEFQNGQNLKSTFLNGVNGEIIALRELFYYDIPVYKPNVQVQIENNKIILSSEELKNVTKVSYGLLYASENKYLQFVDPVIRNENEIPALSFHNFIIENTDITLPLKIISFNGKSQPSQNLLSWQTSSEIKLSHFELEKSNNGTEFKLLGKVNALNKPAEYSFVDKQPSELLNYYRLKSVNNNGTSEYTKIVILEGSSTAAIVGLPYPNPTESGESQIELSVPKAGTWTMKTFDATGIELSAKNINLTKGLNNILVNTKGKGVFMIQLKNGSQVETRKLMVK